MTALTRLLRRLRAHFVRRPPVCRELEMLYYLHAGDPVEWEAWDAARRLREDGIRHD